MCGSRLKNRLRRLVIDANASLNLNNPILLYNHCQEFNDILHRLQMKGKAQGVPAINYDPNTDPVVGGISPLGIAKIQRIITSSQNILNERVGRPTRKIVVWSGFAVIFSGAFFYLLSYAYHLGVKETEKMYDKEKYELSQKAIDLQTKLDSCISSNKSTKPLELK